MKWHTEHIFEAPSNINLVIIGKLRNKRTFVDIAIVEDFPLRKRLSKRRGSGVSCIRPENILYWAPVCSMRDWELTTDSKGVFVFNTPNVDPPFFCGAINGESFGSTEASPSNRLHHRTALRGRFNCCHRISLPDGISEYDVFSSSFWRVDTIKH